MMSPKGARSKNKVMAVTNFRGRTIHYHLNLSSRRSPKNASQDLVGAKDKILRGESQRTAFSRSISLSQTNPAKLSSHTENVFQLERSLRVAASDPYKTHVFSGNPQPKNIHWKKPAEIILDKAHPPFYSWFPRGITNLCFNTLDPQRASRHCAVTLRCGQSRGINERKPGVRSSTMPSSARRGPG
jgi:hypothetical protein